MCKRNGKTRVGSSVRTMITGMLALGVAACARDAQPTPQDPGVITFDGELGHAQVLADQGGEILARLEIGTREVPDSQRPPLNLALVLDTSGSMEGDAIAALREASLSLVDMMREGDFLSVVTFSSEVNVLWESKEVDGDLDELRDELRAMEARGTTALAQGLQTGLAQVQMHRTGETIDRIVLLGDGVPNDPTQVVPIARQAGSQRIAIAALGLGLEYDETLMGQIAQLSQGHFEYVESPERVASVFQDEVLRLERILARNAVLRLQPGPGVELLGIVGQEAPQGGGGLQLTLGDLSEGDRKEVIVRMTAPGRQQGARVELLDAHLSFQDAYADAGALRRLVYLGAKAADEEEHLASRNDEVHESAARLQAAADTLQAIQMVRIGQVHAAVQLLDRAAASNPSHSRSLAQVRDSIDDGPDSYPASVEDAPAARPQYAPEAEQVIREAHQESMEALGY